MGLFIPPCIPTLVATPPEGDAWFHEIKYDGYRTQIHLSGGRAVAFTRNGHDWSMKYAAVLGEIADHIKSDAILDGEMIVQDEAGKSDFRKLSTAIRWASGTLVFYAFDILGLGGNDMRQRRCDERRQQLHEIVGDPRPDIPIQYSQSFEGSGADFFDVVERMGLEGIVSKRRASIYRSGPSNDWVKTKAFATSEFVVIGYERTSGEAPSLLLAERTDTGWLYVGRAIPNLKRADRNELWLGLELLHEREFAAPVGGGNKDATPVRPLIRVLAKHLREEEKLRHATVVEVLGT